MCKRSRVSVDTRTWGGCTVALTSSDFVLLFLAQLAEVIDVFWAPLSALLVFQLYGSSLLSGVALVEELLPFTDIFPTATVGWILQNTVSRSWWEGREKRGERGEVTSESAS